jgi:uncharacterized protein YbjT (DUF2867 family)
MNNSDKTILVTGATGQQGGATVKHLLAKGFKVRALTRNRKSDKAQALIAQGVEVVEGDMQNRASLDAALQGVYGVFGVQNFWLPGVGAEGEIKQGQLLADAAKAAKVKHFVYTSVGSAHRNTGIPHFDSKFKIEQHIQSIGLPYTILRPVFFMDNFNWSRPQITNGVYTGMALRPDKGLQLIAADDIGAFAALAFEKPQEYLGKAIDLAGDELTEPQIAAAFTKVIGRTIALAQPQLPEGQQPDPEMFKMFTFFNGEGYTADIKSLRKVLPTLKTLEHYLRSTGWENAQPLPFDPNAAAWGSDANEVAEEKEAEYGS